MMNVRPLSQANQKMSGPVPSEIRVFPNNGKQWTQEPAAINP